MRTSIRVTFLCWVCCVWSAGLYSAERPAHDGKVILFGNLHAHSKLSDDVHGGDELLPAAAFEFAREHGLDFLAITDHHKAPDSPHRLWLTANEYKTLLYDVAMAYNQAHAGQFIAIPGVEWGNTKTGNHVNVLGANVLPPDDIHSVEYDKLFGWARTKGALIQFNHPNSWKGASGRDEAVGNFGENRYESAEEFVSSVDPAVKTVSIICTVAGGHISGKYRNSTENTHRRMQWEGYYKQFLNMGFHISPAGNQDTHGGNWGVVTAARTAVWADGPTYEHLMNGITANRVYASEDDELTVAYQVKYKGKTFWMGESVPLDQDETDVQVLVKVWQSERTDLGLSDEGPYTVDIISDADGFGGREAAVWETIKNIPSGELRAISLPVVAGEYVYLKVTEQKGKDNPVGDGEDEYNNETGAPNEDGNRDDMNDSAWTSPIWFVRPTASYVWSAKSEVYHDPNCWAVKLIGSANRRTGPAPDGKRKHNCHQ